MSLCFGVLLDAFQKNLKNRFKAGQAFVVKSLIAALKADFYDAQKEQMTMVSMMTFCETLIGLEVEDGTIDVAMARLTV